MLPISSTPRAGCSLIASISESSSRPGFWMMLRRHTDLADVVQEAGMLERRLPVVGQPQLAAEHADSLADPFGVSPGVEVLGLDHLDEGPHRRSLRAVARPRTA